MSEKDSRDELIERMERYCSERERGIDAGMELGMASVDQRAKIWVEELRGLVDAAREGQAVVKAAREYRKHWIASKDGNDAETVTARRRLWEAMDVADCATPPEEVPDLLRDHINASMEREGLSVDCETSKWTREQIAEVDAGVLMMDGFDEAIIGHFTRCGQPTVVAYDHSKCVAVLMAQGLSEEDALDHLSFNCEGAWMGERTPAIVYTSAGG